LLRVHCLSVTILPLFLDQLVDEIANSTAKNEEHKPTDDSSDRDHSTGDSFLLGKATNGLTNGVVVADLPR
jgi:hypothetical protein